MKTLFVLRHAKSSWKNAGLADIQRPLNKRGKSAAPLMGKMMERKGFCPDLIVCSTAVRARMTAELAGKAAGFEAEPRFDERIYGAGAGTLVYIVAAFEDVFDSAMIVGHNPGFEYLVGTLTGERQRMPTAALAVIDLDIGSWADIAAGTGKLREILRPRELFAA